MSGTVYRVANCTKCNERIWLTPSGACSRGHGTEPLTNIEVVAAPPTPLPKTVYCRNCGSELFETVVVCGNCGTPQPAASESGKSGAASGTPGDGSETYRIGGSTVTLKASTFAPLTSPPNLDWAEPYYRDEFVKIYDSKEAYRGQFNWAALIFGPFWALARDLPMVGLIWLLASIVISAVTQGALWPLTLAYNVYFGLKANYLRYTAKFKGVEAFVD